MNSSDPLFQGYGLLLDIDLWGDRLYSATRLRLVDIQDDVPETDPITIAIPKGDFSKLVQGLLRWRWGPDIGRYRLEKMR